MQTDLDLELIRNLAELRRAIRRFVAASEEISRAQGVTTVQYQAMLAICAWDGPMALRDLAEELMLTHSGATQTVEKLASAGLVERRSGEDRRVVLVSLTREGGRLLRSLAQRHLYEALRCERDVLNAGRLLRSMD